MEKTLKMTKAKNLLVMVALLSLFLAATTVSAAGFEIEQVRFGDLNVDWSKPAVVAGETNVVEIWFESEVSEKEVTLETELDSGNVEARATTAPFDVEEGMTYKKNLRLEVPANLDDEVSDDITLNVEIDGEDSKAEENFDLRVQRQTYNPDFMSISTSNQVKSGETLPVDVVVKNRGYNDLDDVYISASIPALGVSKEGYFGDLVAVENNSNNDDDETEVASGRFNMEVPYEAKSGTYALEVKVSNQDTTESSVKKISVQNEFPSRVMVGSTSKSVSVGEEAKYSLTLVNPTDSLKVYRVVTQSSSDVSTSVTGGAVVGIPAGSSKTSTVVASSESSGDKTVDVSLVSSGQVEEETSLTLQAEGEGGSSFNNPLVVLTIILAIVFVVLLVVLVALLTKKSEKSEDFGESYY